MGMEESLEKMQDALIEAGGYIIDEAHRAEMETLADEINNVCDGRVAGVITGAMIIAFTTYIQSMRQGDFHPLPSDRNN